MACEWMRAGRSRKAGQTPPVPAPDSPPAPAPPTPSPPGGGGTIRVTDERDGIIHNRIYSYWPNAVVRGDEVFTFVGRAGNVPRFSKVDLRTGSVERLEPTLAYAGEAEGWYWDATAHIYLCDGPRLRKVSPFTGEDEVIFDVTPLMPGCRLWQAHSSDDGQVHSATVERIVSDGAYPRLGTVVSIRGVLSFYPATGDLDESHVCGDGSVLIIKETFQRDKKRLDNRIISLAGGSDVWVRDEDGAIGHSDMGPNFAVGENDQIGACVRQDLRHPVGSNNQLRLFDTWGMGAVSVRGGRCLLSDATQLALVDLNGGGVTHLLDHGMVGDPKDYEYQVHGNLSPDGRVAAWVSNVAGRMDLYVKEL